MQRVCIARPAEDAEVAATLTSMDRVWVAVEAAVRAGLEDKAILERPPRSEDDVMWLAATITDHVCGSIPKDVYAAFRSALEQEAPPPGPWWRRLRS